MASSRSGSIALTKPVTIHQKLLDGEKFLKWTDQENTAIPVTLMVDRTGYFLYYFDQKDEVSIIDICQIRDVRTGSQAKTPRDPKLRGVVSLGQGLLEEKTITLVYGVDFVNINFINFCSNKIDVAQTWCSELWKYVRSQNPLNISSMQNLKKIHTQLTLFSNGDKPIPVRSVVKYFAQNREDRKIIERALDQSGFPCGKTDEIIKKKFGFEEFQVFYKILLQRSEISTVFSKFCLSEPKRKIMTSKEFLNFLNNYQRDPRLNEILHPYATEEKALNLIRKYEPNSHLVSKNQLSVDGFMWFLMSEDNLVMSPERLLRTDNMEAPMSHYFIASSHNTYLTGHQLTGRSSVEMYRQVLLSGCRCIELDFWNGEEEPHITHGYTMVNNLPAKEVIQAIAECAFKTSEYPLILSFENHCNPKQQAKIAEYCRKYFGDKMLDYPLESHPLEPDEQLPSPELLKEKILIKNKKQHHHNHTKSQHSKSEADVSCDSSPEISKDAKKCSSIQGSSKGPSQGSRKFDSWSLLRQAVKNRHTIALLKRVSDLKGPLPPSPARPERDPRPNGPVSPTHALGMDTPDLDAPVIHANGDALPLPSDSSDDSDSEEEDSTDSNEQQKDKVTTSIAGTAGKESKACAEISALVNYVNPVHFRSFEHAEKRRRSYEMSSFVETTALSLLKEDPVEFVKYNRFQASRIYPRGTRVDSSNYMPQLYWNAGCQLVALNYQTLDVPMQLNLGIFQYNRRIGFIQKPDFMCREDRKFDPFTESSVDGIVSGTVSIQILSGQFLTDKHVGTYVEVEMYGLPRDTVRRGKFKTKTIPSGISPVFNEEAFVFRQVILPDLAVLRIAAFEESGNKLIGHRVLPIVGLCPGYRHIPLFNESGQPLHLPCLFVHITVGDYVPNSLTDLAEALANPIKYQSELERRAKQLAILYDEQEAEAENAVEGDDTQSLAGGGSTPECASPSSVKSTIEYLKRTGSAAKPGGSKDGSPTIGPQRTDSNKSLPTKSDENASNSLENKDLTPETIQNILEHKSVKEKMAELNCKIDQLRKKKEKELIKLKASKSSAEDRLTRAPSKPKNPLNKRSLNKIIKKFSTANLESNSTPQSPEDVEAKREDLKRTHCEKELTCEKNFLLLEKELKEKYLESTFNCAEKVMNKSQSSQLKSLENLHNHEASEVMKRIEMESKVEENEKGSLASISKEDLQRERRARLVKRGVTERGKLQELYNGRRQELEQAQEKVRQDFNTELEHRRLELSREHVSNMQELEAAYSSS